MDDIEKNKEKNQNQKKKEDEESVKEVMKLKELVITKDKEVESLRGEVRKIKASNEEYKGQIELLKKDIFTLKEKSKSPVKTYSRVQELSSNERNKNFGSVGTGIHSAQHQQNQIMHFKT